MKSININFRFPVKQISPRTVEVQLEKGPEPVYQIKWHPDFAPSGEFALSDEEHDNVHLSIIRQIAVIK